MSTSEEEPESFINWDNVTRVFETMTEAYDKAHPRPAAQPARHDLPDENDIGEMEGLYADLSYAETDADKVAVLKSMTLWLAQWKF